MTRTMAPAGATAVAAALAFALTSSPSLQAAARAGDRFVRPVTLPSGTVLHVRVDRAFGSDISHAEDPVHATLVRPVVVDGRTVVPAGSAVSGYVTQAVRPGRVKGRSRVGVRFTALTPAGDEETYRIRTNAWTAVGRATKKKDALTIGVPAAGEAVVGGLLGGKKGAGVGALAGGGAGTAVVLSTRGRDVHVGRGATLRVRLARPVTIRLEQ